MIALLLCTFISLHSASDVIDSELPVVEQKKIVISTEDFCRLEGLAAEYAKAIYIQKKRVRCCNKVYKSDQGFRNHCQAVHTEVKFKCHACGFLMNYKQSPSRHECEKRRAYNLKRIEKEKLVPVQNTVDAKMQLQYILN